eukprot:TRINITY_DN7071_c0_g2_i3.p1 TRINITY_DN7071_c0_g2~~TRINITY_DN7071_c0_g2_i3.p1  ORF type:complete len:1021 (+),score=269.75 TRINITY_DN7071_c0_g2_i3:194-3256(+)
MDAREEEAEVADALCGLEEMQCTLGDFVATFRNNSAFPRRIAVITGFAESDLKRLGDADLEGLFQSLDTDFSGTLSFNEFVKGLIDIREANRHLLEEELLRDQERVIDDVCCLAADAFDTVTQGELDMKGFLEALSNPAFVDRICEATHLPPRFFESMDMLQMMELFKEIDLDSSGSISFEEWIQALIQIRVRTFEQEKQDEAEAFDAVMAHAEDALVEGDEDWSGEFDLGEFVRAFQSNPRFLRKVSLATDVPISEYQALNVEQLENLFTSLDADYSGTISFDEFVRGLVEIRLARQAEKLEETEVEKTLAMEEAFADAAEAFENMDLGYNGELSVDDFIEAMRDPFILDKVTAATKIPDDYFHELSREQMVEMFHQIDSDRSGSVSFNEWVYALVKVREETFAEEKIAEVEETRAVEQLAEQALEEGDEDWSGEFDFKEFVTAFNSNPRFLRKISLATDVPISEFEQLSQDDLEELFNALDTDFSGTISFDEFVVGLLEIRRARKEQKAQEAAQEEEEVLDEAYMDATDAFADADFGYTGELDIETFCGALKDPFLIEKVVAATQLPYDYFASMTTDKMKQLFQQIDTDHSGTVSFNEWVSALVRIRLRMHRAEKASKARARAQLLKDAEEALEAADEDWSGEFDIQEFVTAFQSNPRFIKKVSHATGVPVRDFAALTTDDLLELFQALDTDYSGTVSFEEFVKGLTEIRLANEQESLFEQADSMPAKDEPPPYVVPKDVAALPQLTSKDQANVAEAFSKYDTDGFGFHATAENVASFLQDLFFVVDEKAAKTYIDRVWPGRDLSAGVPQWQCELLYQVALAAQPLWVEPLKKSASGAELGVKDVQQQEDRLREVFNRRANNEGKLAKEKLPLFIKDTGLMDLETYTPRILDKFEDKHKKSASVKFSEVIPLCNDQMTHALANCKSTKLTNLTQPLSVSLSKSGSLAMTAKSNSSTMTKSASMSSLPIGEAAGSPALSLRKRRRGDGERTDWAARGMLVLNPQKGLTKSASTGRLVKV